MKPLYWLVAALGASLFLDTWVCHLIEALPHGDLFNRWRDISDFGLANIYIFGILLVSAFAYLTEAQELFSFSLLGLMSFAVSGLIVMISKSTIGRVRPHVAGDFQNLRFDPLNLNHLHQSFPSAHTQTVFTLAFWLSLRYPRLRVPTFLFAAVIASSRIARNVHFLSDVIAGIIVAYVGLEISRQWLASGSAEFSKVAVWERWMSLPIVRRSLSALTILVASALLTFGKRDFNSATLLICLASRPGFVKPAFFNLS